MFPPQCGAGGICGKSRLSSLSWRQLECRRRWREFAELNGPKTDRTQGKCANSRTGITATLAPLGGEAQGASVVSAVSGCAALTGPSGGRKGEAATGASPRAPDEMLINCEPVRMG